MAPLSTLSKQTARIVVGAAALICAVWLLDGPAPAVAAPAFASASAGTHSLLTQVQIYKRGRPPIYPYYYSPGPRGGWSFYFGPVPYQKGDYETQALQRFYPQTNWPPSMRAWTPQSGF
jgi:hypothetical protein